MSEPPVENVMKKSVFTLLAALVVAFSINLNQASAAGNRWADADVDGVIDSADKCIESAPVGTDTGLINPDTGCFSSPEACVAFRLSHSGNSHDCDGSPKWATADATLEVARGLTQRQRRDGTLVPVAGNSVARKGDKITCSQEGSILYLGGKGIGQDGRSFSSAFGPEQPPFCAHRKYARDAVVAAPRPVEVSKKDLDGAISTATGSIEARLAQIDQKLAASAAGTEKIQGRVATLEGYFQTGGMVDKMSIQLLALVDGMAEAKTAAANAQETADEALAAASGQRAWRFTLRGGVSANTLDVAEGVVKPTVFRRQVDPSVGGRLEVGFSGLTEKRFYFEGNLEVSPFGFGRRENQAFGLGLGGNAGVGYAIVDTKGFSLVLGGGAEVELRLHNLGRDGFVLSETTVFTPRGGLTILCGQDRRFVTSLNAGPSWAIVNWSDGSYRSDLRPNVAIAATAGIRF